MERLLICGISTRAAAESAARAGFQVTSLDGFADIDQHPSVRALSISRDFAARSTAPALARVAARLDADAVAYLSPFENHPRAVARLAAGRTLWGNSPETLRRVRDPLVLNAVLRRHGFAVPRVRNDSNASNDSNDPNDPNDPNDWLLKPLRSGGGNRVRRWSGELLPQTAYLQERIDGTPGSIVFVAAGGQCVPLGFSRQLTGDPNFGAHGHRYCGSIVAPLDDPQIDRGQKVFDTAVALGRCAASEFGLIGINGLDFVARDGVPYPIEVNPRWSASVEVAERAFETLFFAAHAEACRDGTLPRFDCENALQHSVVLGRAIVYARRSGRVGDTDSWRDNPLLSDVPRRGEHFRVGQPVCSVFASADDSRSCYRALVAQAQQVYSDLERATP